MGVKAKGPLAFSTRILRSRRSIALICALIVGLMAAVAGAATWHYRAQALKDRENNMRSLGMVLAEQTARYVQVIDLILQQIQTRIDGYNIENKMDFGSRLGTRDMQDLLAQSIHNVPMADAVALAGADGKLVNWSRGRAVIDLDVSGRDFFQHFSQHDDRGLFVGIPDKSKVSDVWSLFFARRINGRDGQFLGVAVGIVYCDFLRDFYQQLGKGMDHSVTLLRRDGTILLRYPDPNRITGKRLPDGSQWYHHGADGGGSYRDLNFFTREPNLVSVNFVRNYPLAVDVVVTQDAALAGWRAQAALFGALGLLATMCLIGLFLLLVRQFNRQAERAAQLKSFAQMSVDWFWEQDTEHRFTEPNDFPLWVTTYGLDRGHAIGKTRWELADPAMSEARWTAHKADLAARRPFRDFRWERLRPDGTVAYHSVNGDPAFDRNGAFIGYHGTGRDVSEEVEAGKRLARINLQLEHSHTRMDALLSNIDIGVCFFDGSRRLQAWNRRYAEIYQLPPEVTRVGATLEEILHHRNIAGNHPAITEAQFLAWRAKFAPAGQPSQTVAKLPNGRSIVIHYQPMDDGGWVATHEDITERKQAEDRIAFLAEHDALTRLANRELFRDRLDQAIEMTGRGMGFALFWLDLNNFKAINDTFGHATGDELLQAVANRLEACVRTVDTLARLVGDEFAILQLDVDHPSQAEPLAHRIQEAFRDPFRVGTRQTVLRVSIGITIAPADGTLAETLLKNADIALYLAKSEGRGAVRFFEPEMDARIQMRRALDEDLRTALERNQFEIHYQPLINLAASRVIGFEALLRWHHPTRGMISPLDFIPLSEETSLIVPIGDWVLRRACEEAANWPADIKIAVNLSPVQFKHGDVIGSVRAALEGSGLRPDRLELEITETILLEESDNALTCLRDLRAMGIAVALDDFGTGYASLSYLTRFPFDKIKVDKSFVLQMDKNKDAMSILDAIVALGQSLDIRTTAEGVETAEQLDRLRMKGCTEVQGNLFSRPVPAADVPGLIAQLRNVGQPSAAMD